MFNLFKKSGKATPDLSFLAVDMHSHILPGLDDGLKELNQSISLIIQLKELGYKKLIFTPHILSDLYPNTRETILPKLDLVRETLTKQNIPVQIDAAAEYMIDHDFSQLVSKSKRDDLLTINKKYILVEMSYLAPSPNFESVIFDLRMLGLIPILAHPERYSYFHRQFEQYDRFKELGCRLQVNLLSLSGAYGPDVKKAAEKLFKKQMVDFVGTDMHHERHLSGIIDLASKQDFYATISPAELLNKSLLTN